MFWKTSLNENGTNANDSYSAMGNLSCDDEISTHYSPLFGMCISMPEWEALLTIIALGLVIIITIVGKFKGGTIICVWFLLIMI